MSKDESLNEKCRSEVYRKWINIKLIQSRMLVIDFVEDISEGVKVVRLLEILSNDSLLPVKRPKTEKDKIENIKIAFDYIKENINEKIYDLNILNIVSGKVSDILDMLWIIIEFYEINMGDKNVENSKQNLMSWCNETLSTSSSLRIDDLSDSLRDGEVFCSIISSRRSDLLNYNILKGSGSLKTLNAVFNVCEKHFGTPKLFSPSDLNEKKIEEREIMIYLSLIRSYFSLAGQSGLSSSSIVEKIMEAKKNLDQLEKFHVQLNSLLTHIKDVQRTLSATSMPNTPASLQEKIHNFNHYLKKEKVNMSKERNKIVMIYYKLEERFLSNRQILRSKSGYELVKDMEKEWDTLESLEESYESKVCSALEKFEQLENKVVVYTKKVNNRLLWLTATLNFATRINVTNDSKTNNASLKKIEALEKEVNQNMDKIKAVNTLYMELEKAGYFDVKTLKIKRFQIQELWTKLLAMLKSKRSKLEETQTSTLYNIEILRTWNHDMLQKIEIDTRGTNIKGLEEIKTKYHLIISEFNSYYDMVKKILLTRKYVREGVTNEFSLSQEDRDEIDAELERMKGICGSICNNVETTLTKLKWAEVAQSIEDFLYMFIDVFNPDKFTREKCSNTLGDVDNVISADMDSLKSQYAQYEYNLSEVRNRKSFWEKFDSEYTSEEFMKSSCYGIRMGILKKFEDILESAVIYARTLSELKTYSEITIKYTNIYNLLTGYKNMVDDKVYRNNQGSFEAILQNIELVIEDIMKIDFFMEEVHDMVEKYKQEYSDEKVARLENHYDRLKRDQLNLVERLEKKKIRYEKLKTVSLIQNLLNVADLQLRSKDRGVFVIMKVDMDEDPLKIRNIIHSKIDALDTLENTCDDIEVTITEISKLLENVSSIKKEVIVSSKAQFADCKKRFAALKQSMDKNKTYLLDLLKINEVTITYDEILLTFYEDDKILTDIIAQNEIRIYISDQRKAITVKKRFQTYSEMVNKKKPAYKELKKLDMIEIKYVKQRIKDCKKMIKIIEEKLQLANLLFLNITPQQQLDIYLKEFRLWLASVRDMCNKIDSHGKITLEEALTYLDVLENFKTDFPERKNDLSSLESQVKHENNKDLTELNNIVKSSYDMSLNTEMNLKSKVLLLKFENLVAQLRTILQSERRMLQQPWNPESYVHFMLDLEKWKACKRYIKVKKSILNEIRKNGEQLIKVFVGNTNYVNKVYSSLKHEYNTVSDDIKKKYDHIKKSKAYFKFLKKYERLMRYLDKYNNEKLFGELKTVVDSMGENCKQYILYQTYLCNIDESLMHIIKVKLIGYKSIKECPWYAHDVTDKLNKLKVNYELRRNQIKNTIKELFDGESDIKEFIASCNHMMIEIKLFLLYVEKSVSNYYFAYYGIRQCMLYEDKIDEMIYVTSSKKKNKFERDYPDFLVDLEKILDSLKLTNKNLHHLLRKYVRIGITTSYNKHIIETFKNFEEFEIKSSKEGTVIRANKLLTYLKWCTSHQQHYYKSLDGLTRDHLSFNYHIAENMLFPRRFDPAKQLYGRYIEESKRTDALLLETKYSMNENYAQRNKWLIKLLYTNAIPKTKLIILFTIGQCQMSMLSYKMKCLLAKGNTLSMIDALSMTKYSYNYMTLWMTIGEREKVRHNLSTSGTEWEIEENRIVDFLVQCDNYRKKIIHSRCKKIYINTIATREVSSKKWFDKLQYVFDDVSFTKSYILLSKYFPVFVSQTSKYENDARFLTILNEKVKELIIEKKHLKLTSLSEDMLQQKTKFSDVSEKFYKLYKFRKNLMNLGVLNEFYMYQLLKCDENLVVLESLSNKLMLKQLYNLKFQLMQANLVIVYNNTSLFLKKYKKLLNGEVKSSNYNETFSFYTKNFDATESKLILIKKSYDTLMANNQRMYLIERNRKDLQLLKIKVFSSVKRAKCIPQSSSYETSLAAFYQINRIKDTVNHMKEISEKIDIESMPDLQELKTDFENTLKYAVVDIDRREFNLDCHKSCFHQFYKLCKQTLCLKKYLERIDKIPEDKVQTAPVIPLKSVVNNFLLADKELLLLTMYEKNLKLKIGDNEDLFRSILSVISTDDQTDMMQNLYLKHYNKVHQMSSCRSIFGATTAKNIKGKKANKQFYVMERDFIKFYKSSNLDLIQDDFEGFLTHNASLIGTEITVLKDSKGSKRYQLQAIGGNWIQFTIEKAEQQTFDDALTACFANVKEV